MTPADVLDLPELFAATTRGADERVRQVDRLIDAFWTRNGTAPPLGSSEDELRHAETRIGAALAPTMRIAYERWGRCEGLSGQDRLLPPERLENHEGTVIFRVENQGCAAWGVQADDRADDPMVFMTTEPRDPSSWQQDLGSVSDFFVHIALSEALFADCYNDNTAVDNDEEVLDAVKEHYVELAAPRFLWWPEPDLEPARFFGGPDVLIVDHASAWLWVAALTASALDQVRELLPGEWQLAS